MKKLIFLLTIVVSGLFYSCVPGIIQVDNNILEVKMPMVKLVDSAIFAYVFVEADGMPRPPTVGSSNPLLVIETTADPTPSKDASSIYNIIVESEDILTHLAINIPTAEKVKRGPDLDEVFSLTRSNSVLNIKPRTWLETPIAGVTPPEDIKQIKGVVATIVTSSSPMDGPGYRFEKQEGKSVWKFPIKVSVSSPAEGNPLQLNKIEIAIKAKNFLWVEPGNLFPSPIVESPAKINYEDFFSVFVNNAVASYEAEVYAAPGTDLPEIPGVSDIQICKKGIEFVIGGMQYSLQTSQSPRPTKTITTWGRAKYEK